MRLPCIPHPLYSNSGATCRQQHHNNSIRLIAIDMDGTLLGDDGRVSPRNLAALHAAQAAGIQLVVATGRRHSFAMHVLRPLGLAPRLHPHQLQRHRHPHPRGQLRQGIRRPIPSQLIARTHLPHATALWLCAHIVARATRLPQRPRPHLRPQPAPTGKTPAAPWSSSASTTSPPASAAGWPPTSPTSSRSSHRARPRRPLTTRPSRPCSAAPSSAWPAPRPACWNTPASSSPATHPNARVPHPSQFHRDGWEAIRPNRNTNSPSTAPSIPRATSASSTSFPPAAPRAPRCSRSPHARGIDPAEILAIGDNWNDVSMLQTAGRAVLMHNAPEDLKALARASGWQHRPLQPRRRRRRRHRIHPPSFRVVILTLSEAEGEESPHLPFGLR